MNLTKNSWVLRKQTRVLFLSWLGTKPSSFCPFFVRLVVAAELSICLGGEKEGEVSEREALDVTGGFFMITSRVSSSQQSVVLLFYLLKLFLVSFVIHVINKGCLKLIFEAGQDVAHPKYPVGPSVNWMMYVCDPMFVSVLCVNPDGNQARNPYCLYIMIIQAYMIMMAVTEF